jgi:hypothetical protein
VAVVDSVGVQARSSTAAVNVNGAPSVSILPASVILDVGQFQLFTSSVSNGTSPYYYEWYLNGVAVGTNSTTLTFTFRSTGTFTINLDVTDCVGLVASSTATVTVKLHDVVVTNVLSSKTQVIEGDSINVNITVENEGNYTETFDVTLYGSLYGYSSATYTFTNLTLAPGNAMTLTILGLRFGVGFYTLSVCAHNAYFSNTYAGMTVLVAPPWVIIYLRSNGEARPWSRHLTPV